MKVSNTLILAAVYLLPIFGTLAAPAGGAAKAQTPVKANSGSSSSAEQTSKNAPSCPLPIISDLSAAGAHPKADGNSPNPFAKKTGKRDQNTSSQAATFDQRNAGLVANHSIPRSVFQRRFDKTPPAYLKIKGQSMYVPPGSSIFSAGEKSVWSEGCDTGFCIAVVGFAKRKGPLSPMGSVFSHITGQPGHPPVSKQLEDLETALRVAMNVSTSWDNVQMALLGPELVMSNNKVKKGAQPPYDKELPKDIWQTLEVEIAPKLNNTVWDVAKIPLKHIGVYWYVRYAGPGCSNGWMVIPDGRFITKTEHLRIGF